MKTLFLNLLLLLLCTGLKAQVEIDELRFIEVTGSAEAEIDPDEIRFHFGIEEYWKEEFEAGKKYEDYITKIPLEEIETNLMSALTKIGISKDQIIVKEVGRYWQMSGKNFKKSKIIELILTDFSLINRILNEVNVRGVNTMKIAELKNKRIIKHREEVKIDAMQAAKRKANYLLESVGEELGPVISIVEINSTGSFWQPRDMLANSYREQTSETGSDNYRKIKLKYEFKVRFEIK